MKDSQRRAMYAKKGNTIIWKNYKGDKIKSKVVGITPITKQPLVQFHDHPPTAIPYKAIVEVLK